MGSRDKVTQYWTVVTNSRGRKRDTSGSRIPFQDPEVRQTRSPPFSSIRKVRIKKYIAQVAQWGFRPASYPLPRGIFCPRDSPPLPYSPPRGVCTRPRAPPGAQQINLPCLVPMGEGSEDPRKVLLRVMARRGSPSMASRVPGPFPLCVCLIEPPPAPHTEATAGARRCPQGGQCGADEQGLWNEADLGKPLILCPLGQVTKSL